MNMTFVHQGFDPWNRQAAREMTPDAPREATGSKGSDIRQDEKLLLNKSKLERVDTWWYFKLYEACLF